MVVSPPRLKTFASLVASESGDACWRDLLGHLRLFLDFLDFLDLGLLPFFPLDDFGLPFFDLRFLVGDALIGVGLLVGAKLVGCNVGSEVGLQVG